MTDPLRALLAERYGANQWWVTPQPELDDSEFMQGVRVIHKFADFLVSTGRRACGWTNPQVSATKTPPFHSQSPAYPRGAVGCCEQRGGP